MELNVLLSESNYCRLCGEENPMGTNVFVPEESGTIYQEYINKYLPLKVSIDDIFPKKICPGCLINLEATKGFMDLIIAGQAKLREILRTEQEKFIRQENQRLQLEEVLHNVNPNSSVETYTIEHDDNGEKYVIQIISEGPLFPNDHRLSLDAEGLNKPKKKRGRPPRSQTEVKDNSHQTPVADKEKKVEEEIGLDGRRKRRIKVPQRYQGEVQGKELDKYFIEEGVIDGDEAQPGIVEDLNKKKYQNVIGRIETVDGEQTGQMVTYRSKYRPGLSVIRKKKKYTCEACKKSFLHFARYKQHRQNHNIYYTCAEQGCNEENTDKEIIIKHQSISDHKGINTIEKYEDLGKKIVANAPLDPIPENEALEGEQNLTEFQCEICKKYFSCKQNLYGHITAVHKQEKPYKCELCDKSFSFVQTLKVHRLTHNEDDVNKVYRCDSCDKVFTHPSSLQYHKNADHSKGKRYVCNKCDRCFKHKQLLQRHQLVHSDDRPYKCTVCHIGFKTKTHLMNHKVVHSSEKRFCCNQCGNSFAHRTSLTLHLRWHEGHRPYKCDVCAKCFSQKGNLAEHMRTHTGEKPFVCSVCSKSFTTSSQLKLHAKLHTGEKPHSCELCQKRFLHKSTYKAHLRRHVNDKPYVCKYCTRSFAETWALKKHERIHTGERPYKCDRCGRSFSDNSNMLKHRRTHFKERSNAQQTSMQLALPDDLTTDLVVGAEMAIGEEKNDMGGTFEIQQIDESALLLGADDGQEIRIIQDDIATDGVRGLLADGTIVPIDWASLQNKNIFQIQDVEVEDSGLIDDNLQFINTDALKDVNVSFVGEDGQEMCFVTTYGVDDSALAPQLLTVSKDGLLNLNCN
ncbi:unnamed protein product [Brassicogethes aeneus]|uniref:Uncharacterized protein n=1 Tax=Brassicogethes aeneus TaxID=1431903 RepID=A0A9P0B6C3_BRAAE|nr:unnamed protein product [Brassicogethes aeneus]